MITLEKAAVEEQVRKEISLPLNCSGLQEISSTQSIYDCLTVKQFIQTLPFNSPPALYWFSIISNHTASSILQAISLALKNGKRKFPFIPNMDHQTSVLYVGQVSKDLRGRMVSHLGYNTRENNHGLQLCHWAQQIGLNLQVNCVLLPGTSKKELLVFESNLAKKLQPLLGKY